MYCAINILVQYIKRLNHSTNQYFIDTEMNNRMKMICLLIKKY